MDIEYTGRQTTITKRLKLNTEAGLKEDCQGGRESVVSMRDSDH